MEVNEELGRFKYCLEQENVANTDLVKKIDCSEKALFEAQKMIDR